MASSVNNLCGLWPAFALVTVPDLTIPLSAGLLFRATFHCLAQHWPGPQVDPMHFTTGSNPCVSLPMTLFSWAPTRILIHWFYKTLEYWAWSGVIHSLKSNGTRDLWHIYTIFLPKKYTRIRAAQIAISCTLRFPSLNFLMCVCHQIS